MTGPAGLPDGLAAGPLAALRADPAGSAVITDFDGTLAPIVDDPAAAVALPGAGTTLARLAARFRTVAVVSGRPVPFLVDRLRAEIGEPMPPALHLVGLYGLQWMVEGRVEQHPDVEPWVGVVEEAAAAAEAAAPAGLHVERKGLSVGLHWRTAPEAAGWAEAFGRRWANERGLHLQPGRMTLELRPPVPGDKGLAVERLAAGARAACFLGDDTGDLPAFAALDRLTATGSRCVKVAVGSVESPPELTAAADLVLGAPAEALAALAWLADD